MELQVLKRDMYNQTIVTDSSSVLQLQTTLGTLSFLKLKAGSAVFSIAVKPLFTNVSVLKGSTTLHSQPFLHVEGIDLVTGLASVVMQTTEQQVHVVQGDQPVCPPGYVLALDLGVPSPGECTLCEIGKYSLNPLAGQSIDSDWPGNTENANPRCLNCPAGLGSNCQHGGDLLQSSKGNWSTHSGIYYILKSWPKGHAIASTTHDMQVCEICNKGEECTQNACEACSPCQAGYYKAAVSTDSCVECPANTFREDVGATEFGMCLGCQLKSSTSSASGQSSRHACACDAEYYLITTEIILDLPFGFPINNIISPSSPLTRD